MKVIFLDNSTIVLDTLKSLVAELIEDKTIECQFLSDSAILKQQIEDESIEFDLMFTEIHLKNITGYEIATLIKSSVKYKEKPIVAITTEYKEESKKKAKKIGIDEWYIKSITQDSLHSSILQTIEKFKKLS